MLNNFVRLGVGILGSAFALLMYGAPMQMHGIADKIIVGLLLTQFSATCRQMHGIEAASLPLSQSLPDGKPNGHVSKPPPSIKSSNDHFSVRVAVKSCWPYHGQHIPCPPPPPRKNDQQMKVNDKAEIVNNHQTSVNVGKEKSPDPAG